MVHAESSISLFNQNVEREYMKRYQILCTPIGVIVYHSKLLATYN